MAILISSAVRSPTAMPYSRRMNVVMAASMSKLPTRTALRATTPPSEMRAVSEVPPPTSTTMLATGSWIGRRGADGGRHRLLDELGVGRPGPAGGLGDRPPLDLGDGRRHADHDARPVEAVDADAVEQEPDHPLGDLEVGDRSLAERPHGHDVAGRAPDHLPGLVAHRQHLLGALVERDHGRLVEHDAPAPLVDEGVGGAEVDGEVAGHGQRPSSPAAGRSGPRGALGAPQLGLGVVAGGARASISRRKASSPDSSVFGSRCCSQRTKPPTAHTTTTMSRKTMALTTRFRRPRRCAAPRGPSSRRPPTPPASRSAPTRFSSSMANRAASKASARCGRRHGDDDGRVLQLHDAGAVEQRHAAERGPAAPHLGEQRLHPLDGGVFVGLVLEPVHAGASGCVVACRAGEGDRRTAVGPHHPGRRRPPPGAGPGVSATQSSPTSGAAAGARSISCHLRLPAVIPERGRHYRLAPCPWTTMPTTRATGIGPPLPPDDRLWRHPSELTALGSGRARRLPRRRRRARPRARSVWPVAVVAGLVGAALCGGAAGRQPGASRRARRAVRGGEGGDDPGRSPPRSSRTSRASRPWPSSSGARRRAPGGDERRRHDARPPAGRGRDDGLVFTSAHEVADATSIDGGARRRTSARGRGGRRRPPHRRRRGLHRRRRPHGRGARVAPPTSPSGRPAMALGWPTDGATAAVGHHRAW